MTKDSYLKKNEQLALRYSEFVRAGYAGFLKTNNIVKSYKIYGNNHSHTFFGYYDLPQISPNGKRMLLIKTTKNANPSVDTAQIYYIDLEDDSWHFISTTHAWCWQQGCRLRWINKSSRFIVFNDMIKEKYVSIVWDVDNNKMVKEYPYAFYDVDFDNNIGIGLDFSRLQTMRPGYGYSSIEDTSKFLIAPEKGIYTYDMNIGVYKEIISLKELASEVQSSDDDFHYINHICISPDHNKFMFFHLWAKDGISMWKMRLMLSDYKGNYSVLENKDIISHYCWLDNTKLLVSKICSENERCFVIYDVETGKKELVNNPNLVQDGHPVWIGKHKMLIVDTYPLSNCVQKLFMTSIENSNEYIEIIRAFSDPRLYIEHRCDMHPRVYADKRMISIDSTFSDGVRKCILLKM